MNSCRNSSKTIRNGWPTDITNVPITLREYWKVRHKLYLGDNLIFMNNRIVIPPNMRSDILKCIHTGHMGIERSKHVQGSVFTGLECIELLNQKLNNAQHATSILQQTRGNLCCHTQSLNDHGRKSE